MQAEGTAIFKPFRKRLVVLEEYQGTQNVCLWERMNSRKVTTTDGTEKRHILTNVLKVILARRLVRA